MTFILVVPILISGCTVMKVLNSSFDLLDIQKVTSIKQGMTRSEVINILGKPEGKNRKEGYEYYLYIDIHAQRDYPYMQEVHLYYDDKDVVKNTTFQNIFKGDNKNNTSTLLNCFSSLEVGSSTYDQVKESLYPTAYNDLYLNGSLRYRQLQYSTDYTMYMPLKELSFVDTTTNDDNKKVTYSIFFNNTGVLTTPEIKLKDEFIKSLSK